VPPNPPRVRNVPSPHFPSRRNSFCALHLRPSIHPSIASPPPRPVHHSHYRQSNSRSPSARPPHRSARSAAQTRYGSTRQQHAAAAAGASAAVDVCTHARAHPRVPASHCTLPRSRAAPTRQLHGSRARARPPSRRRLAFHTFRTFRTLHTLHTLHTVHTANEPPARSRRAAPALAVVGMVAALAAALKWPGVGVARKGEGNAGVDFGVKAGRSGGSLPLFFGVLVVGGWSGWLERAGVEEGWEGGGVCGCECG
jgi:hypothetical protein